MKRAHLLSTTALALLLLAVPALAQGSGVDAPAPSAAGTAQGRATAKADRVHPGTDAASTGPAELLRSAQSAMRRGQRAQANELLERAETRLLLRAAEAVASGRADQGEPVQHVAEARRALMARDRAEAMRQTNLAIATSRDPGGLTGADAARPGAEGGGMGSGVAGRTGTVDSGMGTLPPAGSGRAVVRDGGSGGTSVTRAEGVVLAQSADRPARSGRPARPAARGTDAGTGQTGPAAAPTAGGGGSALPPGDTLPGWSGARGGAAPGAPGFGGRPTPGPQQDFTAGPSLGSNIRGDGMMGGAPNLNAGPSSSSMTGGQPSRLGGAPPGDTSRGVGSSGIGGAGVGNSGLGGPIR